MRIFLSIIILAWSVSVSGQELSGKSFSTKNGALDGYDPVAYFTDAKPVKGNQKFSLVWNEATWHFASADHLALFKASPQKYAPEFGGFCAYGVSRGYKVKIDPQAWDIQDGKLYLNYDLDVQKAWRKDKSGYIKKASTNWEKIKSN